MPRSLGEQALYWLATAYLALRPPRICPRCGNAYSKSLQTCPRCEDLTGKDLEDLREYIRVEEKPVRELKFVVIVAVTVMTIMSVFSYLVAG